MTGTIDQNGEALIVSEISEALILNTNFVGSYSVDWNGRSTMALQISPTNTYSAIAYFFGQNEGFLMKTSEKDFGRGEVALGSFKQQAPGPFTVTSASGSFRTNTTVPRANQSGKNDAGLTIFDGSGTVASIIDMTVSTNLYHFDFSGAYTVSANGRGTLTFTSPSPDRSVLFWVVSPTELVGIFTVDTPERSPVLLEYEK